MDEETKKWLTEAMTEHALQDVIIQKNNQYKLISIMHLGEKNIRNIRRSI